MLQNNKLPAVIKSERTDNGEAFNWFSLWVTKFHYDKLMEHGNQYTLLGEDGAGKGKRYKVGFLSALKYAPVGSLIITEPEDLRQIDNAYRSFNLLPRPLKNIRKTELLVKN